MLEAVLQNFLTGQSMLSIHEELKMSKLRLNLTDTNEIVMELRVVTGGKPAIKGIKAVKAKRKTKTSPAVKAVKEVKGMEAVHRKETWEVMTVPAMNLVLRANSQIQRAYVVLKAALVSDNPPKASDVRQTVYREE